MFCKHCGKELSDNAVVCPNCGCATKFATQKQKEQEKITLSKNDDLDRKISLCQVIFMWITYGLFLLVRLFAYNYYFYYSLASIPEFIAGILCLGSGITQFVLQVKSKKTENKNLSIFAFMFSIYIGLSIVFALLF